MSQERIKKTVNVQTLINEQGLSGYQKLVLFFCFSILALDGLDTAAVGYIAPLLVAEWGIERAALAPALSAALFDRVPRTVDPISRLPGLGSGPRSSSSSE